MKQFLLFILFPILMFGQTQIGSDIDGEAAGDVSGWGLSLSLDGSTVAIGAPGNDDNGDSAGHVRIYRNISGTWIKIGNDIDGEFAADSFGWSVALSSDGNIVAIGAPFNDGNGTAAGHVRVYQNISDVWSQVGNEINGDFIADRSGWSISLSSDGNIVAIGVIDGSSAGFPIDGGKVKVYQNVSDVWTQIGEDINGEATDDQFGWSISLSSDGSVVAIGSPDNDDNGSNSGHVRVYENISDVWTQIGNDIDGEASGDQSSTFIDVNNVSLSSDGSTVAIGGPFNDGNGLDSGHVRVYRNISGTWTQIGNDIDGEAAGDSSGWNVSLSSDGNIVAIGATANDGNGNGSGHVRVYQNTSGTWVQKGNDIDGEASLDGTGQRVSLSSNGNTLAIGAVGNDGNGSRSGHVRVYNLSNVLSINNYLLSQFSLYPNPVKEQFIIRLNSSFKLEKVKIYNNLGQLMSSTKKNIVNTTNLPQGIYFVELYTNIGNATKKIVIK